jgi:hypothetical protein
MFRAKRLDPSYRDNYSPPPNDRPPVTRIIIHIPPGVELPDGTLTGEGQTIEMSNRVVSEPDVEGEYREVAGGDQG